MSILRMLELSAVEFQRLILPPHSAISSFKLPILTTAMYGHMRREASVGRPYPPYANGRQKPPAGTRGYTNCWLWSTPFASVAHENVKWRQPN